MLSARPVRIDTTFSTKTPGRDLKSRLENANSIATTTHRRGKNVLVPKTPLPPNSVHSKRLFKDEKLVLGTATRPLGDKTPLPNRTLLLQSPSEKIKMLKVPNLGDPILQDAQIEPDIPESMKRPSSLRKHLKLPRNSSQTAFETPMNYGRHWEIDDEDIDVCGLQPVVQEMNIVEPDVGSDEIEYCAPNTLDLPYQPPFDFELPDYTKVGKKIRDLAYSIPFDDASGPPEPEFLVDELESIAWETFLLPPLDSEDPFSLARLESKVPKASTSKLLQKPDLLSHRRVQSSLARLGSGMNRTAPSANSKAVITPVALRKQSTKPASDMECTSKPTTTARIVKPTTVQKRTAAATVRQSRTTEGGPIPSRTRPQTSLALASKNKGTTVAPKLDNSPNLPIFAQQVLDEDFMFNV